ncbi:hypothetical protein F164LOC_15040 [Pectobacterium carotovorum]|nr:hypothetical protein F164LOC_15040 [Pectobacterium carotovorum]
MRWLRYSAHSRGPRPVGVAASSVQICLWLICHSPESLTQVSSSGFFLLPPSCNSNYLGYKPD